MLDECGIEHDLFLTDYAGHAYERMQFIPSKEGDILEYDGIVSMGGDGNLHEILQGIKAREDAEDVLKNVPFGVIGCGSCNGFAKTLLFPSKVSIHFCMVVFLKHVCALCFWSGVSVMYVSSCITPHVSIRVHFFFSICNLFLNNPCVFTYHPKTLLCVWV